MTPDQYIPPVGFFYSISLIENNGTLGISTGMDAGFQEVSGVSASFETETIKEGGENRFEYKVPKGNVTYEDLVLKRGLVVWNSALAKWCHKQLSDGLNKPIQPKILNLQLLDVRSKLPIMAWVFHDAFPVKWEVTGFTANQSEIAIETLTFTYNYFQLVDDLGLGYMPQTPSTLL